MPFETAVLVHLAVLHHAGPRVALVQRSCGYVLRPTLTVADIKEVVGMIKAAAAECIVVVDNCYGEFTEGSEPGAVSSSSACCSMEYLLLLLKTGQNVLLLICKSVHSNWHLPCTLTQTLQFEGCRRLSTACSVDQIQMALTRWNICRPVRTWSWAVS